MAIDYENRPHLFLGHLGYCLFVTSDVATNPSREQYPSVDHLIPRAARNKHKRLFTISRQYSPDANPVLLNIVDDPVNHVSVCRDCHIKIDDGEIGKMKIFKQFGLVGLIEAVALYPRAQLPELYRLQYFQWRTLFGLLALAFKDARDVPEQLRPMYRQTEDLVGRYLYRWEMGHFDVISQCSHDLTERIAGTFGYEIGTIRLHNH